MTTMVRMLKDGKPFGEPTGLDDGLALQWERIGKCERVKEPAKHAKTSEANKATTAKPTK